jgi:hypothetical protein
MTGGRAVIADGLASLPLEQSQPVIYDRPIGPGAYAHFPAGTVMHHVPADDAPCLFVTIFHGPFDVHAAE